MFSLAPGILLSGGALYLAFRNVPLKDLSDYIVSYNYLWILPSVAVVFLSFALRTVRWQIILQATHRIDFWQAFHVLMVGFMLNCILPGRVGEIARPAILKKNDNIPFSTGIATVAVERVFDISLLMIFFVVIIALIPMDPHIGITFGGYRLNSRTLDAVSKGMLLMVILIMAGIIMVTLESSRKLIKNVIRRLPALFFFAGFSFQDRVSDKICTPLAHMVDNFAAGFSMIRHPQDIFHCAGLSVIIWALGAFSFYIASLGAPGIHLSFVELAVVMVIVCFFIALPSVPGFWGLWEAGGVFALALFGVSQTDAAGFTLINHAIQMFPVILIGLASAVITGVNILKVPSVLKENNKIV